MADYFVKTDGNDGNDGTTWALAKATVQAGVNLCSSAGDRCIVAAGRYNETNVAPSTAGSDGTTMKLIGDVDGTYADGGSNYSGVTGYVILDASLQAGNKGWNSADPTAASNNWAYWDWDSIWFTGGHIVNYAHSTSTVNNGTVLQNCIFEGAVGGLFSLWTMDTKSITIKNCISVGYRLSSTDQNSRGMYLQNTKSTAFNGSPEYVVQRCIIYGVHTGLAVIGNDSATYCYVSVQNCTIGTYGRGHNASGYAVRGASATYAKLDDTYCAFVSGLATLNVASGTSTGRVTYLYGASTESDQVLLPPVPYLYPTSPLVDVDGSGLAGTDIFGTTVPVNTNYERGAQEYVTGQYPLEPNMDISNLTTVTPGPSTGGGLSRGRVVNAGGI